MNIQRNPGLRFSSLQITETPHSDRVRLVADSNDAQAGDVVLNGAKKGNSPVIADLTRGLQSAITEGTDAFQKALAMGVNSPGLTTLEDYQHQSMTTYMGSDAQVKTKIISVLECLNLERAVATVKALQNRRNTPNGIEYCHYQS